VVFPFPGPVFTIINPRRTSFISIGIVYITVETTRFAPGKPSLNYAHLSA
jgi:hypothetical protein